MDLIGISLGMLLEEKKAMNVNLTAQLEKVVQDKVASGLYNSASEVVREALRLMVERDALQKMRQEELRKEIRTGLAQANRGEWVPLDTEHIKTEGRRRLKRREKG